MQPVVGAIGLTTPPAAPVPGECWIVGPAPEGAWVGRAGAIAGWTAGGWRFLAASPGMTAWSLADRAPARFDAGVWTIASPLAAIPDPTGGTTIDVRTRTAVIAILAALREHRIIAVS